MPLHKLLLSPHRGFLARSSRTLTLAGKTRTRITLQCLSVPCKGLAMTYVTKCTPGKCFNGWLLLYKIGPPLPNGREGLAAAISHPCTPKRITGKNRTIV